MSRASSREAEMTNPVGRRDFITLVAGAAAGWPLAARAQQPDSRTIGFLNSTSPDPSLQRTAAFRRGLNELGYVERRNLAIEFRWAGNQTRELPRLAADLVRRQVAVIVNPENPNPEAQARLEAAAGPLGMQILALNASPRGGFDLPFMRLVQ